MKEPGTARRFLAFVVSTCLSFAYTASILGGTDPVPAVFGALRASLIVTLNGIRLQDHQFCTSGAVRPGIRLCVVYGEANTAVQ